MNFNEFGEYQPVEIKAGCLPKCDLCLRGCPFWNQEDNEDTLAKTAFSDQPEINHRNEIGYYLKSYVGYSNMDDHRKNGASGGMTTWLLETLLLEGFVDHAICVTHNPDPERLFKFSVLSIVKDIRGASRSCYYPVELSEVIDYVLQNEGRYAITGLPCFLKGLRLAMRHNRRLRERLIYLIGITCGQLQSKHFAEYLCLLKNGEPKYLTKVTFRVKDQNRPSSDFGFKFECSDGRVKENEVYWSSGMGEIWHEGYFTPNACLYCDDIFAEVADVVFMDAWLPGYSSQPEGTNLLIVRSPRIAKLLEGGLSEDQITLNQIDIQKVIDSQMGVIHKKKNDLAFRISVQIRQKTYIPQKRLTGKYRYKIHEKIIYYLKQNIREKRRTIYSMNQGNIIINIEIRLYKLFLKISTESLFLISKIRKHLTILSRLYGSKR